MKIAFVTNICPHYRVKTFETLSRYFDTVFYFFSAGDEWYWQQQHGVKSGDFRYEYLPGWRIGKTRFTPSLISKLWFGNYDVYVKCINGRFALPITYLIARLKRRPFVLWTGIWMRLQTPAHRLFYPITRYIYRNADAVVVYGEHVKRFLVGEGVLPERIFVAAHAVDNNEYNMGVSDEENEALRNQLKIKPHQKVILNLGRHEKEKGIEYLIEAFVSMRIDDVVLVLAGTGTETEFLKQLVVERNISDSVRFVGYVPAELAVRYYAIAWVVILPSVTISAGKEPWGLVVNEAFNQGVPVIATDAVGAAAGGLVRDGDNGLIVPERDSDALAESMKGIIENESLRASMSNRARHLIVQWDNERMVQGFVNAIQFTLQEAEIAIP